MREFGVGEQWSPSRTSVQQVADRLAEYGTALPGLDSDEPVWVGTPLRVHRRCDRPMFSISNQIAYDGLMVFGTPDHPAFRDRDVWCDIRSATSNEHWIPAEGHELRSLLSQLRRAGVDAEEIRVISPFRVVVSEAMKAHESVFPEVSGRNREQWVGTVHTMQGKEADVVILVLGGNPDRPGARWFATQNPICSTWPSPAPNVVSMSLATETPGATSRTSMSWRPASPPGTRHPIPADLGRHQQQPVNLERARASWSRLSTYMSGKVVPSATLMVRMWRARLSPRDWGKWTSVGLPRQPYLAYHQWYILLMLCTRSTWSRRVEVWLLDLPYSHYQRVMRNVDDYLVTGGVPDGDHVKKLQDVDDVYELRIALDRTTWRISFWKTQGQVIILLTVFRKTREGVQRADVDRAVRMKETCQAEHDMTITHHFERNA